MPLHPEAAAVIRENLEQIRSGRKASLAVIGELTPKQLADINRRRSSRELPPISAEVVFIGRHIYQSRIVKDGYTIEDVIEQISSALHPDSVVLGTSRMTALESAEPRKDRYGNTVKDRAIFECSARHPRPELFSVVPRGDSIKPLKE